MKELSLVYKPLLTENPSAPLLFLVHGRAGNVDVMWTFKSYFPKGWNIVSMQAPLPDPLGGFSWWQVQNVEVTLEAITDGVRKLDAFINEFISAYGLTPSALFGAGFSQGAASLSYLIQKAPTRFQAVALLAGFIIRERVPLSILETSQQRPEVFMAHGTKDDVVTIERALEGKEYLENLNFPVQFITDDVGHKVGTTGMRGLRDFLQKFD